MAARIVISCRSTRSGSSPGGASTGGGKRRAPPLPTPSPPGFPVHEDHARMSILLSHLTMEALRLEYGSTGDTIVLAFSVPSAYQGAYSVRCILRKLRPRQPFVVVESHDPDSGVLVRCQDAMSGQSLHVKYKQWGEERASFFLVASVALLVPDPLDAHHIVVDY